MLGRNGPRGDEGIGLVNLASRHDLGQRFQTIRSGGITSRDSAGIPGVGGNVVERKSLAGFVQIAEKRESARIPLIRGETCPVCGLRVVGCHANAFKVAVSEAVLGGG